ncbi:MAG: MFS transporter [Hyphomicrobiaceae bacterium]|nr:MAG: MFS transporter [Hyphomicrobiaceae bacterium]
MPTSSAINARLTGEPESREAWLRLVAAVLIGTIGSVGMWSIVVALPVIQADFGIARAEASLPYTMAMVGFAVGGVAMGRLADRTGIVIPVLIGAAVLFLGYLASAFAANARQFALVHLLIGIGSSTAFAPLVADISHWFTRRRGIAVAICASGNYLGGAVWPPIVHALMAAGGWRQAQIVIGMACLGAMAPLALALRRQVVAEEPAMAEAAASNARAAVGLSPVALQVLLCVAGLSCCVAMSMPQVHIVAYCGDLGYGVARGAEMLSLMLGLGIVSRIASGFIADRIGGLATLLLGSMLQGVALFLYLLFDGLTSLYVISALFGLFQGGIVPMYAIITREFFPPQESGARVGLVIMATIVGMALGGWMSGVIFDVTGSYWAAFANGLLWNLLNVSVAVFLLLRRRQGFAPTRPLSPPQAERA